jgi:hypothetical protein
MQLNSVVEVISPLFLTIGTFPENNTKITYFERNFKHMQVLEIYLQFPFHGTRSVGYQFRKVRS